MNIKPIIILGDKNDKIPLDMVKDHYPKYLLTMDLDPETSYNGIRKLNVLDWLLDRK